MMPLSLVTAQMLLISLVHVQQSCFLPEAASIVMIINLMHIIKDCEDLREGACASDRWNIGTNIPTFASR